MINKNKYDKLTDKKVLHKVKKQWIIIGTFSLIALGAGSGVVAHADTTNDNHSSVVTGTQSNSDNGSQSSSTSTTNQSSAASNSKTSSNVSTSDSMSTISSSVDAKSVTSSVASSSVNASSAVNGSSTASEEVKSVSSTSSNSSSNSSVVSSSASAVASSVNSSNSSAVSSSVASETINFIDQWNDQNVASAVVSDANNANINVNSLTSYLPSDYAFTDGQLSAGNVVIDPSKHTAKVYIYNKKTTSDYGKWGTAEVLGQGNNIVVTDGTLPSDNQNHYNRPGIINGATKLVVRNVTLPADSSYLFADIPAGNGIDLSNNVDSSHVTDMEGMFSVKNADALYGNGYLGSVNFGNFDTSHVTNMSKLFYGQNRLKTLDLSSFDTSNVTDMSKMFANTNSLKYLDLSNFNTDKVTNFRDFLNEDMRDHPNSGNPGWFTNSLTQKTSALQYVDLSSFNTKNVAPEAMNNFMVSLNSIQALKVGQNMFFKNSPYGGIFNGAFSEMPFDMIENKDSGDMIGGFSYLSNNAYSNDTIISGIQRSGLWKRIGSHYVIPGHNVNPAIKSSAASAASSAASTANSASNAASSAYAGVIANGSLANQYASNAAAMDNDVNNYINFMDNTNSYAQSVAAHNSLSSVGQSAASTIASAYIANQDQRAKASEYNSYASSAASFTNAQVAKASSANFAASVAASSANSYASLAMSYINNGQINSGNYYRSAMDNAISAARNEAGIAASAAAAGTRTASIAKFYTFKASAAAVNVANTLAYTKAQLAVVEAAANNLPSNSNKPISPSSIASSAASSANSASSSINSASSSTSSADATSNSDNSNSSNDNGNSNIVPAEDNSSRGGFISGFFNFVGNVISTTFSLF